MEVSEATTLLENAFRDAFGRKRHTTAPSYAASIAAIRGAAEALTTAMKRNGATPEAVVLEVKRIARAAGGFEYPREVVAIAMQEAIAVYFRPRDQK
jgi:hypothetical protein